MNNYARENLHLEGVLQRYQVTPPVHPDDYFWRGEASIAFSHEFLEWQKSGVPAVFISSVVVTDLPSTPTHYSIKVESNQVISEAYKTLYKNKQLFFSTAFADGQFPLVQSYNAFPSPVSLSAPQNEFKFTVDVIPYYESDGQRDGNNLVLRRCNTSFSASEAIRAVNITESDNSTSAAATISPSFEVAISFMRRSSDVTSYGVQRK